MRVRRTSTGRHSLGHILASPCSACTLPSSNSAAMQRHNPALRTVLGCAGSEPKAHTDTDASRLYPSTTHNNSSRRRAHTDTHAHLVVVPLDGLCLGAVVLGASGLEDGCDHIINSTTLCVTHMHDTGQWQEGAVTERLHVTCHSLSAQQAVCQLQDCGPPADPVSLHAYSGSGTSRASTLCSRCILASTA